MTEPIFVQCAHCGQTIDQLAYVTPGFYRKITCPHCHELTVVGIDHEGQVKMVKGELVSTEIQYGPPPSKDELLNV